MGYRNTFLKGIGWNGSLKVVTKLIAFGKLAVISRLLTPADFGIFALALIAISLFEVFTETGINIIIVQSDEKMEHFIDTAWLISIVRGLLISGLMIGLAYPFSWFYHEPQLPQLIWLASIVPLMRGFINPAIISAYKNLKYHVETSIRLALVVIETGLTISLAFLIGGPQSLIIPMIISALAEVIISFWLFTPRPQLRFKSAVFHEIMKGMKWLNGLMIFEYLRKTADDMIVGRLLGTANLGIYRLGYNLPQSSTNELGNAVVYASLPVYKKLNAEPHRFRRAIAQVMLGSTGLLLLPTLPMIFFPTQLVSIVFGSQWLSIANILPFLAIAGYIQALVAVGANILTSKQAYSSYFILLGISFLTLIISIVPLIHLYGLQGAGWSVFLSRLVTIPVLLFLIKPHIFEHE